MKTGIEIIAAERERQITAEGWSTAHDDAHSGGEMADAAACYAHVAAIETRGPLLKEHMECILDGFGEPTWPWDPEWFKPQGGLLRNLAKAGALIAAEIDRLQREEVVDPEWRTTCCGAESVGASRDMGMCPDCKEHCEYELS